MLGLITGFLFFSWTDFIITPLYIYLAYRWFNSFVNKTYQEEPYVMKMLMYAFWFKIGGSLFINSIYEFYYRGGDVQGYYGGSEGIYNSIFYNPVYTVKMFFSSSDQYRTFLSSTFGLKRDMIQFVTSRHFLNTPELTAIKMAAIASFACFHTYTTIGIIFALFAFAGSFKLFLLMRQRYPHLTKPILICCFFIPSVIVWGGGVLKDPLTYGGTCFIIYYLYEIFVNRKFKLAYFVYLVLASALVVLIKPYIFMSLTPAVFFFLIFTYVHQIKSKAIFTFLVPFVIVITIGLSFVLVTILKNELGRFSLENIQDTLEDFQTWHEAEAKMSGGSGYTLGAMDFSTTGLLKKIPLAINVTYFRPYIWEARKPIIFLGAVESLLVFFFFIRTLYRAGIRRFFRTMFSDPFTIFCILFALIFGTAVGLSSYNFGALARYKIPGMPFFVFAIYIINDQYQKKKKTKSEITV